MDKIDYLEYSTWHMINAIQHGGRWHIHTSSSSDIDEFIKSMNIQIKYIIDLGNLEHIRRAIDCIIVVTRLHFEYDKKADDYISKLKVLRKNFDVHCPNSYCGRCKNDDVMCHETKREQCSYYASYTSSVIKHLNKVIETVL